MDIRKEVIREMMRAYREMDDSNPNKKEFYNALMDEMCMIYEFDKPTTHLLEKWIDNEFRTELEEKLAKDFNLEETLKKEPVTDYVFKLPNLDKK